MKKHFVTYGDDKFIKVKERISREAQNVKWFDSVISYGPEDISNDIIDTGLMKFPRGGGLWAWKPDIILKRLKEVAHGDIIVYADSGCSLNISKEWRNIEEKLSKSDVIAQKIYQRTDKWTRKEILNAFKSNPKGWENYPQICATVVIIKKTEFTLKLIAEWRKFIIDNSEYIKDVQSDKIHLQHKTFIENRHDQAIYSALIYKYLSNVNTRNKIYTQWEHIEDYDPFKCQAIRATRLRDGEKESSRRKIRLCFKRIIKDFIYKPFYHAPLQWWYSR